MAGARSSRALSAHPRVTFSAGVFSILDTETGEVRELFSSESLGVGRGRFIAAISPDNRDIYLQRHYTETAISMLTLGDQN